MLGDIGLTLPGCTNNFVDGQRAAHQASEDLQARFITHDLKDLCHLSNHCVVGQNFGRC